MTLLGVVISISMRLGQMGIAPIDRHVLSQRSECCGHEAPFVESEWASCKAGPMINSFEREIFNYLFRNSNPFHNKATKTTMP